MLPALFLPILLVWSAAWIAFAGIGFLYGLRCPDGEDARRWWTGFWCMNLFWIAIDVLVVLWLLVFPIENIEGFRLILAVCAGLDCGYLVVGIVLATRKSMFVRGFGWANIIQGAFLVAFDFGWWIVLGSSSS